MASEAYEYLYIANWPEYIRCLLFGTTTKHPTIKEFQKYTHQIEDYLRGQILKLRVDTIHEELDAFVGTIFNDVCISSIPGQDGIYYFYNSKNKLILMVAVIRPGGSIG